MDDFLNVEDLSEDDLNAILGLSSGEDKAAQLQQQLSLANKLRNQAGPEGRGYGGVYTAASPLEHVAYAWRGIKAGKDADRITQEQNELMKQQVEARKKFFESMIKRQQPHMPQTGYGPQPFDPSEIY